MECLKLAQDTEDDEDEMKEVVESIVRKDKRGIEKGKTASEFEMPSHSNLRRLTVFESLSLVVKDA